MRWQRQLQLHRAKCEKQGSQGFGKLTNGSGQAQALMLGKGVTSQVSGLSTQQSPRIFYSPSIFIMVIFLQVVAQCPVKDTAFLFYFTV